MNGYDLTVTVDEEDIRTVLALAWHAVKEEEVPNPTESKQALRRVGAEVDSARSTHVG